jgi:hypothetical protein
MFVAYDADPYLSQLSLSDPDSCPMFGRWRRLRKSGITVDFQRILRFDSAFPHRLRVGNRALMQVTAPMRNFTIWPHFPSP